MDRAIRRYVLESSKWTQVLLGILTVAVAAGAIFSVAKATGKSPCDEAFKREQWKLSASICQASYERTGDEHEQFVAFESFFYAGQYDQALRLSSRLLLGAEFAAVHNRLAFIEQIQGGGDPARDLIEQFHLAIASAVHAVSRDRIGTMRDEIVWSDFYLYRDQYEAALNASARAIRLAHELDDRKDGSRAYLPRVNAFTRIGALRAAHATWHDMDTWAQMTPCEAVDAYIKSAEIFMEEDDNDNAPALALNDLRMADIQLEQCPDSSRIYLSQIWFDRAALLNTSRPDEAYQLIDKADNGEDLLESQALHIYNAAARGAVGEVEARLTQAQRADVLDADWALEFLRIQGNWAEMRGADKEAEAFYRAAVAKVAELRASSKGESGYILASHRGVFDDLMSLLARHEQWSKVLDVIIQLDSSDMLHANDEEGLGPSGKSTSVSSALPTVEQIVETWKGRDLVIVVAPSRRRLGHDPNRAYRMQIYDGQVTGEDIGAADALRNNVKTLRSEPLNFEIAKDLASKLIPGDSRQAPLYVLSIGVLSRWLPYTLRDPSGRLAASRRTLLRVQGLFSRSAANAGNHHVVVFADSMSNLKSASREDVTVATSRIGDTAVYKADLATRQRFYEVRNAELLHIAGHTIESGRTHAIQLADGEISPRDIIEHRIAPRIAVLSTCDSALADDQEGWSSIAAAFLSNGSQFVVATAYSVYDDPAAELMDELYKQPDVSTDPAHALAVAEQTVISRSSAEELEQKLRSWTAFSVMVRPPVITLQH
jgi:hypothetical protein